jgi:hypothetical protein
VGSGIGSLETLHGAQPGIAQGPVLERDDALLFSAGGRQRALRRRVAHHLDQVHHPELIDLTADSPSDTLVLRRLHRAHDGREVVLLLRVGIEDDGDGRHRSTAVQVPRDLAANQEGLARPGVPDLEAHHLSHRELAPVCGEQEARLADVAGAARHADVRGVDAGGNACR